ncbi:MAG TPA: MFS transporter, partial [Terriglobales bacterium]|nr:MFS transporter [Terriglobales bacterium]
MSTPQLASAPTRAALFQVVATAFVSLFCVVGLAFWGLPFFYDFMVRQFGWTHAQVTSGNALAKLVVGPVFAVLAGYIVDRFGPRRILMLGVTLAGVALIALAGATTITLFRAFFLLNALGYVLGGPLPVQVLLSRWFDRARGKAMGMAYLGIGLGGAVAPWMATPLVARFGWQLALATIGAFIIVLALPMAWALP